MRIIIIDCILFLSVIFFMKVYAKDSGPVKYLVSLCSSATTMQGTDGSNECPKLWKPSDGSLSFRSWQQQRVRI